MRRTILAASLAMLAAGTLGAPRFGVYASGDGSGLPPIRPVMTLRPVAADNSQYELLVYGDIGDSWWGESVTALDVVTQLQALDSSVKQINVRVNSYGGSVSDGVAIYNALKRNSARKVITVDGVAMSSASLIVMAGDEVLMPPTSLMMIHAPWGVAQGNAQDMRVMADVLDTYANAMATAYTAKSGKAKTDVLGLLQDGQDHYFTGEQAVAEGFADALIADEADDTDPGAEASAQIRAAGVNRMLNSAPEHIRQLAVAAALRHPRALSPAAQARPATTHSATPHAAVLADLGDSDMKLRRLFASGVRNKVGPTGGEGGGGVATPAAAATAANVTDVHAALRTRNEEIKAVLEPYMGRTGVNALYVEALADPSMTVDGVRAKLLPILGAATEPARSLHVEMGTSEPEKLRGAAEQHLLARYNVISGAAADAARQGNPFARSSLVNIAEQMLILSGVNTRTMGREEIARRVLGAQTSSDFPILLENVLHKTLIGGYHAAPFTWSRFCTTGTLVDYRPHGRYHLSSFSDLQPTNEHGEYQNGTLGDGTKETIVGQRKGRIMEITPEVLINDDLGALIRISGAMGQAAGRTIEKDVYSLFLANGGNGPTMGDGYTLFHAKHGNIAATGGAPSVTLIDAGRVQMAEQMDPAGNDYLDIAPTIWLGPMSLGGQARVINRAEYDPDTPDKLQRPNMVNNLFKDIIDTPRLTGTPWYMLADFNTESVFEVAFLEGVQTPTLEQELNFRTDGIAWKAVHRYGVAAVGWRGALKNPGQ